jgi:hypothetical protein
MLAVSTVYIQSLMFGDNFIPEHYALLNEHRILLMLRCIFRRIFPIAAVSNAGFVRACRKYNFSALLTCRRIFQIHSSSVLNDGFGAVQNTR